MPCPHTAQVLCDVLLETFFDWNVERKLLTLTVDNCSSNDAMINILLEKLGPNAILLGGKFVHMRCAAHILNLIVKDGLEVIKEGIEKIRESVSYWIATAKREEKFKDAVRHPRITYSKKLNLDYPTKWNSIVLMLQTALEYKNVFSRLKQRETQYKSVPSEEEWKFAKEVCERLKLFL